MVLQEHIIMLIIISKIICFILLYWFLNGMIALYFHIYQAISVVADL